MNGLDPSGHLWGWAEWLIDKAVGIIEHTPGGTVGVLIRAVSIFGPLYVAAIIVSRKFKNGFGKIAPPGSIGRANGGTRASQRSMVDKYSDPDGKD